VVVAICVDVVDIPILVVEKVDNSYHVDTTRHSGFMPISALKEQITE
jgi:hypothetical protein